jgi:hypothetical protein
MPECFTPAKPPALRWHQQLNPLYLLILILERLYQMPDINTFRQTVADFKAFVADQLSDLDSNIKTDIDNAIAQLPEGVPQEVIDSFTDLKDTLSARVLVSKNAAAAEVPAAPVPPVS